MRMAALQRPESRTAAERRHVLRAAVRQLERADAYLGAVAHMEVGDWEADRSLRRLRADVESLRRHLADIRAES